MERRLERPIGPLRFSSIRNPWIRPCVYSPPSFRDKDETMIDRRREGGEESFESSRGEALER